ncbi:MAG: hypothetical protein EOP46_03290 [Sphingobacteriaceae bacterium]|nr:MAG: hypothetical protein EOP46_03290 [Sphingobacteriaceae bacterium]
MKKSILTLFASMAFVLLTVSTVSAQVKKQEIKTNASKEKSEDAAALKVPKNIRGKAVAKKRGDECGDNKTDVIIKNHTSWYINIWVDNDYVANLAPGYQTTACAIPGTTKLYGKADFNDGSYLTWGPVYPKTGYEYTWNLHP